MVILDSVLNFECEFILLHFISFKSKLDQKMGLFINLYFRV